MYSPFGQEEVQRLSAKVQEALEEASSKGIPWDENQQEKPPFGLVTY